MPHDATGDFEATTIATDHNLLRFNNDRTRSRNGSLLGSSKPNAEGQHMAILTPGESKRLNGSQVFERAGENLARAPPIAIEGHEPEAWDPRPGWQRARDRWLQRPPRPRRAAECADRRTRCFIWVAPSRILLVIYRG